MMKITKVGQESESMIWKLGSEDSESTKFLGKRGKKIELELNELQKEQKTQIFGGEDG